MQPPPSITVTRRPRALWEVPLQPPGEEWAYQIARAFQLTATEIGLVVNIRRCHVRTVDLEVGNDLVIVDRLEPPAPKTVVPLNRSTLGTHPRSGQRLLMSVYPLAGGFVPFDARRTDGTPHPHAGTGFALSHIIGHPVDEKGNVTIVYAGTDLRDPYVAMELQQYRYDGKRFAVERAEVLAPDAVLPGWEISDPPLGNCLPDGDALIAGLSARPAGSTAPSGSGLARWQRLHGRWRPVSFTPVPGAEQTSEPSLVRDQDSSLLFTARAGGGTPDEGAIRVWRSRDGGAEWEKILHAPGIRARTPVTINQALDGTIYVAGNPHRETDSRGRTQPSIEMRETLLLWPLSEDRRRLLEPVTARDCNTDFGTPPFGSIWRADHPVGLTVHLADGLWHHLLSYRVLEQNECVNDAPATPFTGTYIEEVSTPGPAIPHWRFA